MNPNMQKMLEDLLKSADVPQETREAVAAAMADPTKVDEAFAQLKAIGADQIGSGAPLNIADFYKAGSEKYEQLWPIQVPFVPMPFAELDRKTQFFVLFGEWTRREMEGMMLLNSGDVAGAESVFEECLARAQQIEVGELKARSCEGFMRIAQRRGDRGAEKAWMRKAAVARQV